MNDKYKNERKALLEQSEANMAGLLDKANDKSLEKEAVHLKSCEDAVLRGNAYKWCKRCLGGTWAKISLEDLSVQYLRLILLVIADGGLTNYLYLCSMPEDKKCLPDEPSKVLLRIYGEILDNRAKFYEGVIFTLLAERGVGPHLYGVFSSGRVEQYVPARHLKTKELGNRHLSQCIAAKLARYHSMQLPLNKEPSWIWESMETWISVAEASTFDDPKDKEIMEKLNIKSLTEEYLKLKSFLIDTNSEVVFCHNDAQEGNILLIEENGKQDVLLIDYEYSSYNYRGFEFGNHFCEWMYDYSNNNYPKFFLRVEDYPTKDQQRIFISAYLRSSKQLRGDADIEPTEEEIEQGLCEANRFALASHLFWGFWSIVQAKLSKIEFGFLEYALARFETYFQLKKLFWPQTATA
eukprot:gene11660-21908_t